MRRTSTPWGCERERLAGAARGVGGAVSAAPSSAAPWSAAPSSAAPWSAAP